MESIFIFGSLCLAMFVGCYLAGFLPLAVTFSEAKLRIFTVLGAGLLVGTALAVIIPEGVQAIYSVHRTNDIHSHSPGLPLDNKLATLDAHEKKQEQDKAQSLLSDAKEDAENIREKPKVLQAITATLHSDVNKVTTGSVQKPVQARRKRDTTHDHAHTGEHDAHKHTNDVTQHTDAHKLIGVALVLGFVFMLLVDQLSQRRKTDPDQKRYNMTATIGLVVHAAADGIALGAASTTSHTDIQFIVFVAIMLHKAPAAFGLVTFLLHDGFEKSKIRKHLLVFSLAAPVAAVMTFAGIRSIGGVTLSSVTTTGVLMLFSAGTFLYVATVHVLPEMLHNVQHGGHSHLPVSTTSIATKNGLFTLTELVVLTGGAIVPVLLTLGHSHSH